MNCSPDQNEERDDLSEEIESMFKDLTSDATASNASYRCPNCGALCANADKGCSYCGSQIEG